MPDFRSLFLPSALATLGLLASAPVASAAIVANGLQGVYLHARGNLTETGGLV